MNKLYPLKSIMILTMILKASLGYSASYKVSMIEGIQFITVTEEISNYEAQNIFLIKNDINVYLPTVVHFNSPGGSLLGLSTVEDIFRSIRYDILMRSHVPVYGFVAFECNSACIPAFLSFKPHLFAMSNAIFGFHAASGGLNPELSNKFMIRELTESSGYDWMNRYQSIFNTTDVTSFTASRLMQDKFRAFVSSHPERDPIILSRFSQVIDEMYKKTKQSISCYKKKNGTLWNDYGTVRTNVKPGESSVLLLDNTFRAMIKDTSVPYIPSGFVEVELLMNNPHKPERGYTENAYFKIRLKRIVAKFADQIPDYNKDHIIKSISSKREFWVRASDIYCGKE